MLNVWFDRASRHGGEVLADVDTMGAGQAAQRTRSRCRAIALHQSKPGVLTVRCAVRVGADDPGDVGAELIFVRRSGDDEPVEHRQPLRRVAASETGTGEVVLEARIALSRHALEPGRWHVRVALGARRMPVHAPSSGRTWPTITFTTADGPYTASLLHTKRGVALHVVRRKPYVEVDTLDVEGPALRIDARMMPDVDDTHAELVVRSRRRPSVAVTVPVNIEGGRLHTVLDLDTLPSDEREIWDLRLRLASGRRLRLGSHLDEIGDKRSVLTFPAHHVDRAGRQLAFQPFYTARNTVSVLARPVEEEPDQNVPDEAPSAAQRRPLGRVAKLATGALLSVVEAAGRVRGPRARGRRRPVYFLVHDAFGGGGIARTVLFLARHLVDDHDVEIITLRLTRRSPAYEIDPRVRLTCLVDQVAERDRPRRGLTGWLRRMLDDRTSWLLHEDEPMFSRQSLWGDLMLLRALHRMTPGVLVSTLPGLHVAAARFARRGVATVGWEHQTFIQRNLFGRMRAHYPKLDALTVLTARDAELYREVLAGTATSVLVIPNALAETPTVRADLDAKCVTAAGRYVSQKGFELLIEAFAVVARKHPDWQLRIYGKGPLRDSLRRQIHDAGLHRHVLLMGRTDQLSEELARSSIFALSSRWEGFGLVIIEAMALGLPVVSFDCPYGPASIITDGVDGTLVPAADVDALARGIIDLIESREKRHAFGTVARQSATAYDIEHIRRRWCDVFDEVDGPAEPSEHRAG